jgi:hypothetical protein
MSLQFTQRIRRGALPMEVRSAIGAACDAAERYSIGARLRTGGRYSISAPAQVWRGLRGFAAPLRTLCYVHFFAPPFSPRAWRGDRYMCEAMPRYDHNIPPPRPNTK